MPKSRLIFSGLLLCTYATLCAAQQSQLDPSESQVYTDTVNRYCVGCHNDTLLTAGLSLQRVELSRVADHAEILEKVIRKLKVRSMPPAGMPRPDEATYDAFANYLVNSLDSHAQANPRPGRPAIRRLNRTEYMNAVRDLLNVEIQDESILCLPTTPYMVLITSARC